MEGSLKNPTIAELPQGQAADWAAATASSNWLSNYGFSDDIAGLSYCTWTRIHC